MEETKKAKIYELFKRIAMLITCLLMLSAIAINKTHTLMGHPIGVPQTQDTATTEQKGNEIIIHTAELAKDVHGFGGPTPLDITIKGGKITSIEALENAETPSFFAAAKEQILPAYIGLSVKEAQTIEVDGVSGATLSSNALKTNIARGLESAKDSGEEVYAKEFSLKHLLALIVALCAAILPLFIKNKWYRIAQLTANIAILGIYSATFVSYSAITNVLSSVTLSSAALGVLLIVAFLYPLFGKKGYYCAWVCPLGSAQEMMGKIPVKKWAIGGKVLKGLEIFRLALWSVLMLLAWSGILMEWMDYELFTAFAWQTASWVLLALAGVTLILSIFVQRPYCRFVCPTGTILKNL